MSAADKLEAPSIRLSSAQTEGLEKIEGVCGVKKADYVRALVDEGLAFWAEHGYVELPPKMIPRKRWEQFTAWEKSQRSPVERAADIAARADAQMRADSSSSGA